MDGAAPAPRKKSYAWAWFLLALAVASVALAAFMVWYNLRLQLKPEHLDAAMARWKAHGPRDYQLTYTVAVNEQSSTDQFVVKVRGGRVQEVLQNGRPLDPPQLPYHSMDRLFAYVEKFQDLDRKPGQPKTYTVAVFDDTTGALKYYVRRVMGTRQRVELRATVEDLPS